jgi:hypothetical protein
MSSLIVPSHVAQKRRAELAQPRGKGLGPAVHDEDPKEKIYRQVGMKKLGEIPGFPKLHGNRVLIAVYERPEAIAMGEKKFYLSDMTRKEDSFQGKAGLILMKGHSAFVSDEHFDFGPDHADLGDWVPIFVADGRSIIVNGCLCRVVRDQDIIGVIESPDVTY